MSQARLLEEIITRHEQLYEAMRRAPLLGVSNYYIGGGCLTQTVWNYLCGLPLDYGINDMDLVYFDQEKISFEEEALVIQKGKELFADLSLKPDIKNQARVHIWYEERFGYPIQPYTSVEHAIDTWPTTATAIGMRWEKNACKIYAPFGLHDLFGMIVRANKVQITKDIFDKKVMRWSRTWKDVIIIPWESDII
ncbi:nucleotidyltransferase family protein [Brevibacillus panacihumi]|nr:nucleotidyltransferase family protein [Brevibacillus panacihumi]